MPLVKKQETTRVYDEVKKTTCGNCPTGCGLKVFLHEGRVVDIFGDEEHPINKGSLCPKGLLTQFHLGHPKRVVTAGIRRTTDEELTAVSSEAAVDYLRTRIEALVAQHGQESVVICCSEADPFEYRMGAAWFTLETGIGVASDPFRASRTRPGRTVEQMFGIPPRHLLTNHPRDWCNSRCIVLYASDLARSCPVTFGPIIDARDRGAALVVIDHCPTRTSRMATDPLIVQPGTRSTLLKGIIRSLVDRDLVGREFIRRETSGFDTLSAYLQPYTIERVAGICRIDPSVVAALAERIGKLWPVQVIAGDWASRDSLEDDDLYACALLACLRGSIGVPGGGLNFLDASPFAGAEEGPSPRSETDLLKRAKVLICCGNPLGRRPELENILAASDPLIVHLSLYPNTTRQRSHVSIPASSWLEYDSIHGRSNSRSLQAHRKVVASPGECRSPIEFWTALALAIRPSIHPPWFAADGSIDHRAAADFWLMRNALTRPITFAQLDPQTQPPGGVLWPCIASEDLEFERNRSITGTVRGRSILFLHGQNYPGRDTRFPTSSGRIEFQRPEAALQVETNFDFPLSLVVGVDVDFVEEFGHAVNDEITPAARPLFRIHRALAAAAGVGNGDTVTLRNDFGCVSGPVRIVPDIDPMVIRCPTGVEPCQLLYPYAHPPALFDPQGSRAFARVILFKNPADEIRVRHEIARMTRPIPARPEPNQ